MLAGVYLCTPTTFQKLNKLSPTQFRPEPPFRLPTVYAARTASFVGRPPVTVTFHFDAGANCMSTKAKPR